MNIRKFIDMLEEEYQRQLPYSDVMGEPEIVIDVFETVEGGGFQYAGFTTDDIVIDSTADGVYRVITAFAESYPKETKNEQR